MRKLSFLLALVLVILALPLALPSAVQVDAGPTAVHQQASSLDCLACFESCRYSNDLHTQRQCENACWVSPACN